MTSIHILCLRRLNTNACQTYFLNHKSFYFHFTIIITILVLVCHVKYKEFSSCNDTKCNKMFKNINTVSMSCKNWSTHLYMSRIIIFNTEQGRAEDNINMGCQGWMQEEEDRKWVKNDYWMLSDILQQHVLS